jgi:CheY-like chemotaxis protein
MEKKPKVIIVDDDKFLLNMYSIKFKKSGLDVDTACGPQEALSKLHEHPHPEILILDLIMPGMDGLNLLEALQKEKLVEGTTVVMLTNQGQQSDIDRASELGVHGYIVKATTIPSEVVEEVMEIFTKRSKKK